MEVGTVFAAVILDDRAITRLLTLPEQRIAL
jgi:hypothetical protein